MAHSLGGPTILAFLNGQSDGWVRRHIASFVPVAAPWGGSTEMLLSQVSGFTFGIPGAPFNYLHQFQVRCHNGSCSPRRRAFTSAALPPLRCSASSGLLTAPRARPGAPQASAASGVFILPTEQAFGSEPVMTTSARSYSAGQMRELLLDLGADQQLAIFDALAAGGAVMVAVMVVVMVAVLLVAVLLVLSTFFLPPRPHTQHAARLAISIGQPTHADLPAAASLQARTLAAYGCRRSRPTQSGRRAGPRPPSTTATPGRSVQRSAVRSIGETIILLHPPLSL